MDGGGELERIDGRSLLLVEGRSDDRFFTSLFTENGIPGIQVHSLGSKDRLGPTLQVLPRLRGYSDLQWLGIVQDADTSAKRTLDSINAQIRRASERSRPLRFPECRRGWQSEIGADGRSTTAFVVPPDADSGDLEEWLMSAIPMNEHRRCAESLASCLGTSVPRQRSKLVMAANLAAHDPEKLRIGDAIQNAGVLPLVHDFFRPFLDLIPADDITP